MILMLRTEVVIAVRIRAGYIGKEQVHRVGFVLSFRFHRTERTDISILGHRRSTHLHRHSKKFDTLGRELTAPIED